MLTLGKDVFIAMAAVAWADHRMKSEEARTIYDAAKCFGMDAAALEEIAAATREPISLWVIHPMQLTLGEKLFVYALAIWVALADGFACEEEVVLVDALGQALALGDDDRWRAASAALGLAALAPGIRPARFDILELARRLGEPLSHDIGSRE